MADVPSLDCFLEFAFHVHDVSDELARESDATNCVPRHWLRDRLNLLDEYRDTEFLSRFRFTKSTVASLLTSLPLKSSTDNRGQPRVQCADNTDNRACSAHQRADCCVVCHTQGPLHSIEHPRKLLVKINFCIIITTSSKLRLFSFVAVKTNQNELQVRTTHLQTDGARREMRSSATFGRLLHFVRLRSNRCITFSVRWNLCREI